MHIAHEMSGEDMLFKCQSTDLGLGVWFFFLEFMWGVVFYPQYYIKLIKLLYNFVNNNLIL